MGTTTEMKTFDNWARLAGAAADARDALRSLIPRLDKAIAAADVSALPELRAMVIRHADSLRIALKHPAAERQQNTQRPRAPGLSGCAEASGGQRYRPQLRRPSWAQKAE